MTILDFSPIEHLLPDELLEGLDEWRDLAECIEADPGIFFPVVLSESSDRWSRYTRSVEAKAICSQCCVQRECLVYAFQTRQLHGIWGGLTPPERGIGSQGKNDKARRLKERRVAHIRRLELEDVLAEFM